MIFHGLTDGCGKKYAINMALRTVIISIMIVISFAFFGENLLMKLGISIEALRVSGGLLLFYTAFNMVTKKKEISENHACSYNDISVYPMSIPLIAGPGCLTLTILLFSKSKNNTDIFSILTAVLIIYATTLVSFFLASRIKNIFGTTGDDIIKRLLGVILSALAIQFIVDGIKQIV